MEKVTITPLIFEEELDEIRDWDKEFRGTSKYENFEKFLFENGKILGMAELICTNYEIYPIGNDEIKLILIAKNNSGKIIGFTIQCVFGLETNDPELFLQYIIIHPDFQHKGIGTHILNNISSAIEKVAGKKPKSIFSYINKENIESQNLYKKFGLNFEPVENDDDYLKAYGVMPEFQNKFE